MGRRGAQRQHMRRDPLTALHGHCSLKPLVLAFLVLITVVPIASARTFNCSRVMLVQDGYGYSGPTCPNPIQALTPGLLLYNTWPTGLTVGSNAFMGAIKDGQNNLWIAPYTANAVLRINVLNGTMTTYNSWPAGFAPGSGSFGGVGFDGSSAWFIPHRANAVLRINVSTGNMTMYNSWPAGLALGSSGFTGVTYDGRSIWTAPHTANAVLRINVSTGNMTMYNSWPAGLTLNAGSGAFAGIVYDTGESVWMAPHAADGVVKVNISTGNMTLYNTWPTGLSRGASAFLGAAFDGQSIYLIPRTANAVVKINTATGNMTLYNAWPTLLVRGSNAFQGGTYDGKSIWLAPFSANGLVKIDAASGTMAMYNTWPTGYAPGSSAFAGAAFDGQSIWLIPQTANGILRIVSTNMPSSSLSRSDTTSGSMEATQTISSSSHSVSVTRTADSGSETPTRMTLSPTLSASSMPSNTSSGTATRTTSDTFASQSLFKSTTHSAAVSSTAMGTQSPSSTTTASLSKSNSVSRSPNASSRSSSLTTSQTTFLSVSSSQKSNSRSRTGSIHSPSASGSWYQCAVTSTDVVRNSSFLSFTNKAADAGPSAVRGGGGGIRNASSSVVAYMNGQVPMGYILNAAGTLLHVAILATEGFVYTEMNSTVTTSIGEVVRVSNTSNGIYVTISLASLETSVMSAVDNTPFLVSVDVSVTAIGVPCRANVKLIFLCIFLPLRPLVPLQTLTQSTFRVSSTVSSFTGNPVSAMSNTGIASLQSLEECIFSDVDPLDASVSPLGFAFGAEIGQYYRGAVACAFGVYGGIATLALLASLALPRVVRGMTSGKVIGLLRLPSSAILLIGVFHQGMVCVCLIRVAAEASSRVDMLLGVAGLLVATCIVLVTFLAGTERHLRCHQAPLEAHMLHSRVPAIRLFLKLAVWKLHWLNDSGEVGGGGYKRRYFFILDDMSVAWWTGVELSSGLLQGIVLGVRKNDLQVCQLQRLLLVAHCAFMLAAAVALRPCGSHLANFFLIASKLGSFLVSVMIVVYVVTSDDAVSNDADLMTVGFAFLSTIQSVLQLALFAVVSRKGLLSTVRLLLSRSHRGVALEKREELDERTSLQTMMTMLQDDKADPFSENPAFVGGVPVGEQEMIPAVGNEEPRTNNNNNTVTKESLQPGHAVIHNNNSQQDTDDDGFDINPNGPGALPFDDLGVMTEEQLATFTPEELAAYAAFLMRRERMVKDIKEGLSGTSASSHFI